MFQQIMVPVDLARKDSLTRALEVACDLALLYDAKLTLVSVSGGLQAEVSHFEVEYARQLAAFAEEISLNRDIDVASRVVSVPDPSVEVDGKLLDLIDELETDLVVMASHPPGWSDRIVNSHGGRLARLAPVSVFVVRG